MIESQQRKRKSEWIYENIDVIHRFSSGERKRKLLGGIAGDIFIPS